VSPTPSTRRAAPAPPDVPALLDGLRGAHPDATCALTHRDPFQLLVATILSAQCTDARVNLVTPGLFAAYPDAAAMARVSQEELEGIIRSTGFYRNKAKAIRGAAERLLTAFGGRVPRTMEELLTLPGVARKTANVVLGVGFGVAEGVVVDTHVQRLARRLGLSRGANPEAVERELMGTIPRESWIDLAHLLIFHGRRFCRARAPLCGECPLRERCPSASYFLSGSSPPWERKGRTAATGKRSAAAKRRTAAPRRKKTAARSATGRGKRR
jgi:endonuclease-3